MKEIEFSWLWSIYDARGYERDGHTKTHLRVVPINQMQPFCETEWRNDYKNRIQMSTYDYRVVKDTPYSYWNGCIFIDIDYKRWVKDKPDDVIPSLEIGERVWRYMQKHYPSNLYYGELSRSYFGFHYIFYYDCERTKPLFERYNKMTQRMVEKAFEECGYGEIIHHKGVFDDCSKSFCQCCYLTRNQERFNDKCTGELVAYPDIQVDVITEHEYNNRRTNKWNFNSVSRNDDIERPEYIDHFERWRLFEGLAMIFKDDDRLIEEWGRCAQMIPEQNGHTFRFYLDEPYVGDWYRNLTGNEYVDTELLEKFGYKIEINPKPVIVFEKMAELIPLLEL